MPVHLSRDRPPPAERLEAETMTGHSGAQDADAVQPGLRENTGSLNSLGADVAHELANLLTVVLGSLEQLRRQPLDERGQRQLARAEWGAWQAGQLTRRVLSQARGGEAEV